MKSRGEANAAGIAGEVGESGRGDEVETSGEVITADEVVEVVGTDGGASANARKRELEEYSGHGTYKKQKVSKKVTKSFI